MQRILTVSEITEDIKEVLENVFAEIFVQGEISNLRSPSSGHVYFSLKDNRACLRCVLFRNSGLRLAFRPADGMQVIAGGRIGVYERDGQYQLYVNTLEPKGAGALQLALEQLKEKLSKEGLFEEARKKPLPFLPSRIAVVTSPTGAVIRDILRVLERRFSKVQVTLHPVKVQGEGSAQEIAEAIRQANELATGEVVIVARGGGSLEDLWSFNEEAVARAIYASDIPVISAVGHETDWTIADLVADKRAPTPSAAAEIVVPESAQLHERINSLLRHLWRSLSDVVPQHQQRIDDLCEEMKRCIEAKFQEKKLLLEGLRNQLGSLDPLSILSRGYSVTTTLDGKSAIRSAAGLKAGDRLKTRLAEGSFVSTIEEVLPEGRHKKKKKEGGLL